jgi:phage tail-like protein
MDKEVFSSYYFTIEIDGIQTDHFFSCEGLEIESNVYEVEEGGYNPSTHKRIGRTRSQNLILKKGINKNNELNKWFQRNQNGNFEKKTLSVIQMHSSGVEIKRWNFYKAFPCRWKVQTLDAQDTSFPIEIIEIAYG